MRDQSTSLNRYMECSTGYRPFPEMVLSLFADNPLFSEETRIELVYLLLGKLNVYKELYDLDSAETKAGSEYLTEGKNK